MITDKATIAWATGLFEGEGFFTVSIDADTNWRHVSVEIGMTDKDVIDRFHTVFGFGDRYEVQRPAPRKRMYVWKTGSFEQVQAVMAALWAGLCSRRRAKIRKVLVSYHAAEPDSVKATRELHAAVRSALKTGTERQCAIAARLRVTPATITLIKQGPSHVRKKQLTPAQHEEIRYLHASGWSQKNLAERFKCSAPNISLLVNGKRGVASDVLRDSESNSAAS